MHSSCFHVFFLFFFVATFAVTKKKTYTFSSNGWIEMISGQIIATSHDLGPQKVATEGKSPHFREISLPQIVRQKNIYDKMVDIPTCSHVFVRGYCFFDCTNKIK